MNNTILQTNFSLCTAVISNGVITGNSWSNEDNLILTDLEYAESNPGAGVASDVIVGNFNLVNPDQTVGVPANAVITGIEIQLIGVYSGAPTSPSITITPYFVDNSSGENAYYPYITPQTITPTPTDYVLGSPTYLFASAFTPDQINSGKIALVANGDVFVDAVKMSVFYYVPTSGGPVHGDTGGLCSTCNSPIQAQPFYLALPFKADDQYAYLESFNYPDGTPIAVEDLGACGGTVTLVFDPVVPKIGNSNFEENARTGVWTTLANGQVRLDFGIQSSFSTTRGLQFHTPYESEESLRSDHDAGAKVIISDSAPFLGQYLQQCQVGSVFSAPIHVRQSNADVVYPATKFNFLGAGVLVTQNSSDPLQADIMITGAGGTTPPVIVGVGSGTSGNVQVASLTYTIPISGLNRGCAIEILTEQATTVTGVTVGGVAASAYVSVTDTPHNLRSQIWFVVAPPLGTQPVVIILSVPAYISSGAEALVGVDSATPIGTTQSAVGSSNFPSLVLTTTYNNSTVIDSLGTAQTPILYIPSAGQALNWSETANGDTRQGGSSVQPAGLQPDTVTMQYNMTQNTPWVYTALEIKGITMSVSGSVDSVTGLNTDNTDPANPVVKIAVDGTTITGLGTLSSPLVALGGGSGSGGATNFIDQTPSDGTYGLLAGAVNGTNTVYTVSQAKYLSGKLTVYLNGLLQLQGAADDWQQTSPGAGTFTFNLAPLAGDIITALYQTTSSTNPSGTFAYVAKSAAYTVQSTDYTIDCTGTFPVTLLDATTDVGQIFVIKNSGVGVITLGTTVGQMIDGSTSQTITTSQSLTVQSTGTGWIII